MSPRVRTPGGKTQLLLKVPELIIQASQPLSNLTISAKRLEKFCSLALTSSNLVSSSTVV